MSSPSTAHQHHHPTHVSFTVDITPLVSAQTSPKPHHLAARLADRPACLTSASPSASPQDMAALKRDMAIAARKRKLQERFEKIRSKQVDRKQALAEAKQALAKALERAGSKREGYLESVRASASASAGYGGVGRKYLQVPQSRCGTTGTTPGSATMAATSLDPGSTTTTTNADPAASVEHLRAKLQAKQILAEARRLSYRQLPKKKWVGISPRSKYDSGKDLALDSPPDEENGKGGGGSVESAKDLVPKVPESGRFLPEALVVGSANAVR